MLPTLLIVPNKIDADDPCSLLNKVTINANIEETKLMPLWKFDTNDFIKITHTSALLMSITLIKNTFEAYNTYEMIMTVMTLCQTIVTQKITHSYLLLF